MPLRTAPTHRPRPAFRRRTPAAVLAALAAFVLLAQPLAAAVGRPDPDTVASPPPATFGIGPVTAGQDIQPFFSYQIGAGGNYRDRFAVLNFGPTPLTLSVSAADLTNDADGGFTVGLASARPTEAGAWVHLPAGAATVRVPARSATGPGRVVLPFSVEAPANASPGDHAAALVATLTSLAKDASGQNVRLDQRIASRVYLRVTGQVRPELDVSDVSVDYAGSIAPLATGTATVSYTVSNTGNVKLGGRPEVDVTSVWGASANARGADIPLLLPGASIRLTTTVEGVTAAFRDTATVTVTPVVLRGDVDPAWAAISTSSVAFWAVPWTLVGIVAVLLLAAVTVALLRRRRTTTAASAAAVVPRGRHAVRA
jgi:hypothetical protein